VEKVCSGCIGKGLVIHFINKKTFEDLVFWILGYLPSSVAKAHKASVSAVWKNSPKIVLQPDLPNSSLLKGGRRLRKPF
jgi:hypothetical protein